MVSMDVFLKLDWFVVSKVVRVVAILFCSFKIKNYDHNKSYVIFSLALNRRTRIVKKIKHEIRT